MEDTINSIKELVLEFDNVTPNVKFVVELVNVILKYSLVTFNGEYFQQNFGVIIIWVNWKSYCGKNDVFPLCGCFGKKGLTHLSPHR